HAQGCEMMFNHIVERAAGTWPPPCGDTNLVDVHLHATRIVEDVGLSLPADTPPKATGVEVVEIVDQVFIKGILVRTCPPDVISNRAEEVVALINQRDLLAYEPLTDYVVALFIWHGCIHMAKTLRPTYGTPQYGEQPYTMVLRQRGYAVIEKYWQAAVAQGNTWVRYGVSLARLLETRRRN